MQKQNRTTWYNSRINSINFTGKVNSYNLKHFCSAVGLFLKSESKKLVLDFRNVEHAYPNGMLPIIMTVFQIRSQLDDVFVYLPNNDNIRKLFRSVNWAHYLSPSQFEMSESEHDKHLVTRTFNDLNEQQNVVNDFMDMVLRTMELSKDLISGLEWSINEITDNVLNHAESEFGGLVQASAFPKNGTIAFAVADGGRGILDSLKEGMPSLRTDIQAIGEAIKAGVTRGKEYGQGNGLAGSLRVATMTGGSFEVTSGSGRLIVSESETKRKPLFRSNYQGTIVCGQLKINPEFSVINALNFENSAEYSGCDIIESFYESENENILILKMKEETTGFGTRKSGAQIHLKILNLLNAKNTYPIQIDWEGVPLISSSFADELLGKLFLKLGALTFSARIRNVGMEELIVRLIDKAISQRLTQSMDDPE